MLDVKVETFLCACKYMNFTRAAEHLHITQSAVSQQIRALEEYYGTQLFVYKKRALSLTNAGIYLKNHMRAMYNDTLKLKDSIKDYGKMPTLKIGTTMSVGDFFMPAYLARYIKANPETKLFVTRLDTKQIFELLNSGELDFAIIEGNINKNLCCAMPIKQEEIVIACSQKRKTEKINKIEDLFKLPLLIREEGSGTREVFLQSLALHGYSVESFEKRSVFNSPMIIRQLLLQDCGISVLYKAVIADCLKNKTLKEIKIPNFSLSHEFCAVWRKGSLYGDYYEKVINEMFNKKI